MWGPPGPLPTAVPEGFRCGSCDRLRAHRRDVVPMATEWSLSHHGIMANQGFIVELHEIFHFNCTCPSSLEESRYLHIRTGSLPPQSRHSDQCELNEDSHAALSRPQLQTPAALGKPALTQQQYQSRFRIWISELVWLVRMLQWYVKTNLTKTKGSKEESLCVLLAHPPRHQNCTSWRAAWYYCCNDVVLM